MKINYDRVADAIYLLLRDGKVAKTLPVSEHINIDLDSDGATIGIELLDASSEQGTELQKMIKFGIPVTVTDKKPAVA